MFGPLAKLLPMLAFDLSRQRDVGQVEWIRLREPSIESLNCSILVVTLCEIADKGDCVLEFPRGFCLQAAEWLARRLQHVQSMALCDVIKRFLTAVQFAAFTIEAPIFLVFVKNERGLRTERIHRFLSHEIQSRMSMKGRTP